MSDPTTEPIRRHILVADDEAHIGRIVQLKLEQGPYRVTLVADGAAALERVLGPEPVDIVLLDLFMPRLNGLEVLREIRRVPELERLPVIILTAKGEDPERKQAMALGASDFLTKPFSPNKLLARINEIFGI
jgi:two-component system, OmpR family, alkaline phosphatase synthesis response regulator PhoP